MLSFTSRSPESKNPQVLCGTEFHGYMDVAGTEPAPTDAGDEKWSLKIFREGFRVYLESENWGADIPVIPISPQRGLETCPKSQRRWCGLGPHAGLRDPRIHVLTAVLTNIHHNQHSALQHTHLHADATKRPRRYRDLHTPSLRNESPHCECVLGEISFNVAVITFLQ